MNYYILITTFIVEYFVWVAWLRKDGFYKAAHYQPNILDAIHYTFYRFYYSLPGIRVNNAIDMLATESMKMKAKRVKSGNQKSKC